MHWYICRRLQYTKQRQTKHNCEANSCKTNDKVLLTDASSSNLSSRYSPEQAILQVHQSWIEETFSTDLKTPQLHGCGVAASEGVGIVACSGCKCSCFSSRWQRWSRPVLVTQMGTGCQCQCHSFCAYLLSLLGQQDWCWWLSRSFLSLDFHAQQRWIHLHRLQAFASRLIRRL